MHGIRRRLQDRAAAGLSLAPPRAASIALILAMASGLAASCGEHPAPNAPDPAPPDSTPGPDPTPTSLALREVARGLVKPVFLTGAPGDRSRLFVVEREGRIRVIAGGALRSRPFLDIRTLTAKGGEQGLLGLAFDPDYERSGRFFVFYTAVDGDAKIARYRVSADPEVAVAAAEAVVLTIDDPDPYHNGGMLAFGPDGMLWASMGDGGGSGDRYNTGQNTRDLLGSLIRIDVRGAGYAVPPDNPFEPPHAPEIWNYGLRNPWRFSFDRGTGDLYIADVGQGDSEEIDVAPASAGRAPGANYGWSVAEGARCYERDPTCDLSGLVPPVFEYDHSVGGCAIIGGYVYRGSAIPDLAGAYFYGDYCRGFVRSFRVVGGRATQPRNWTALAPGGHITSFGEDTDGELYVIGEAGGVWKIVLPPS